MSLLGSRSIVLVGMMGVGKSSIGRRLAARLGIPFVDADTEIEKAAGMSIADIFARHGEADFRSGEARVIARLLDGGPQVLATGGGAVMNADTRAAIKAKGVSIWLSAELDVLMRRINKRKNDRPMLQTANPASRSLPQTPGRARAVLCPGRSHGAVARSAARRDRVHNHDGARRGPQCTGIAAAGGRRMTAPVRNDSTIVNVALGTRSYDIVIGRGLLASLGARIAALRPGAKAVIVTDDNVARYHLRIPRPKRPSRHAGVASSRVIVPAGEASKSYRVFEQVCEAVIASRIERGDLAIALGGGHRRPHRFRCSGGAARARLCAGPDHVAGGRGFLGRRQDRDQSAHGKNLIGAFHQPRLVIADTALLDTLPERELRAGYAEVVKYGLLGDADFFAWLEKNWREVFAGGPAREHAIAESCRAKAAIVARDERETGDRALLNLGHTFGHALEAACGFSDRLLHGEAIGAGMALAFEFSARRQGLLATDEAKRAIRHLAEVGLPTRLQDIPGPLPSVDQLMDLIAQDKKVKRGMLTFILVRGIGAAFIEAGVDAREVRVFLSEKLAER